MTSFDELHERLGGIDGVMRITGAKRSTVYEWFRKKKFPGWSHTKMQPVISARRIEGVDPSFWHTPKTAKQS